MALKEHLEILKAGREAWNTWIIKNWKEIEANIHQAGVDTYRPAIAADLSNTDLSDMGDLSGYDFYKVDFSNSNLSKLKFKGCRMRKAVLYRANLQDSIFDQANLDFCNLMFINGINTSFRYCSMEGINLSSARLYNTNFKGAKLPGATLLSAHIIESDFTGANISYAKVFGASVWRSTFVDTIQKDLVINKKDEPLISIDNIEIAQFIYLLINNEKIRNVINTVTTKMVLILGRFSAERLEVLRSIREELRTLNYLPVLFDFEQSSNRDVTETISLLAHMSRFVIADITDARSIPQELSQIVPNLPSVPVQPIIATGHSEYGMFEHFKRYKWVMSTVEYETPIELNKGILKKIIAKAEKMATDLNKK